MMVKQYSSPEESVEAMITNNQWPDGGLPQLQEAVEEEYEVWAKPFVRGILRGEKLHAMDVNRFFRLMMSALYTHQPNGRVAAVADLRVSQVEKLLSQGHAMSTKLKTRVTFGYQDIILDERVSGPLVQLYVRVIRKRIVEQLGKAELEEPASFLWLKLDGKCLDSHAISRAITDFFKKNTGKRIGSNTMRAVVETAGAVAYEEGLPFFLSLLASRQF